MRERDRKPIAATLFVSVLAGLILAGCASGPKRPPGATDYRKELGYPEHTPHLSFVGMQVYDDPWLGAGLKYHDRGYRLDYVDVYIYPVSLVSWDDPQAVCEHEAEKVFEELDRAVEQGYYRSRSGRELDRVVVEAGGEQFRGARIKTELVRRDGNPYHSYIYVFLKQDKFIKFRISIIKSEHTVNVDERYVVDEILPGLSIPGESRYMKQLRARRKKEEDEQVRRILEQVLKQAVEQQESGRGESGAGGGAR